MITLEVDDMQKTADNLRTKGATSSGVRRSGRPTQGRRSATQTATTSSFGSGSGNPMRNKRAGDPLSYHQLSPIVMRWHEWSCALTESSDSQVTPRRREADSNHRFLVRMSRFLL